MKTRRCKIAGVAILVGAALNVVHMWYCLSMHPEGVAHDALSVVVVGTIQAALLTLMVWLGIAVYHGRRLGGAIALEGFVCFAWLATAAVLVATGDYPAPPDVIALQGALVTSFLAALLLTIWAVYGRGRKEEKVKEEKVSG